MSLAVMGLLLVALATVPVWGSDYLVLFFMLFCFYLGLSQMWNLLAGYSGLISLGQQVFIGLGGYTMAVMTNYYGVNIWLSVFLGGVFSAAMALFMSLFIFRMKGVYFAIGTWVFAEATLIWFSNWEYVKYGMGLFVKPANPPSMTMIFYGAFITGVGAVVLVYILLRSRLGLGLMAMRDDEAVAETMGVEVFRSKLTCFVLAAFTTGLIAGIYHHHRGHRHHRRTDCGHDDICLALPAAGRIYVGEFVYFGSDCHYRHSGRPQWHYGHPE